MMLFYMADADGNGKVTREEFEGVFDALDGGRLGFVSQDELRQKLFTPAGPTQGTPAAATPVVRPVEAGAGQGTVPPGDRLAPGRAELDDLAPDFTLSTVDGQGEVTLCRRRSARSRWSWSSATSPAGRSGARPGNIEKLFDERYKDRATFVMVYVREAHPTDGWSMESNDRVGVSRSASRRTYDERVEVARKCSRGRSTWASRCWSTPSTTPSVPATAGCPAGST